MKKWVSLCVLLLLASAFASAGMAGEYGDKLTSCMLKATTKEDKRTLVRWLGYSVAKHEAIAADMSVPEEKLIEVSNEVGALVIRLMADVCREYTEKAIELEGPQAVQQSFHVFGQAASFELFSDSEVQHGMSHVGRYLKERFPQELQNGL